MGQVMTNQDFNSKGNIQIGQTTISLPKDDILKIQENQRRLTKQIDSERQIKSKRRRKFVISHKKNSDK